MIRLTLTPTAQSHTLPDVRTFLHLPITIGSDKMAALALPQLSLLPVHLKIVDEEGIPTLINAANDPFATVNGLSFGKKKLKNNDIIALSCASILFEIIQDPSLSSGNHGAAAPLLADNKENGAHKGTEEEISLPITLSFENEVIPFEDEEIDENQWEALLKENNPLPSKGQGKPSSSLKDDYLKDLEDKETSLPEENEVSHLYQAWKWILLFTFSLITIAGAAGTIIYFSMSDKAEAQETKAMQGTADIAMALTHARLNGITPHNHNWSDTEFIRSNLQAILPDIPSHASGIDAMGQFNTCPYTLRIYTSRDLSHFFLVAQPSPSFLNWLLPPQLIVIDSHLMEIRIVDDVKNLNRLLAQSDPIDEPQVKEITALVEKGTLMPLSKLAKDARCPDFAPPKKLAWHYPGSENLIYNAPRYFRIGCPILQHCAHLVSSEGSSHTVAALRQSIDKLPGFHHFVLYTQEGPAAAARAREGLNQFLTCDKFIFGYLSLDETHQPQEVRLLKDNEEFPVAALKTSPEGGTGNTKESNISSINRDHPIYIQLQALLAEREREMKSLANQLIESVQRNQLQPYPQHKNDIEPLFSRYLTADDKYQALLANSIVSLYRHYPHTSPYEMSEIAKALHLEAFILQNEETAAINHPWKEKVESMFEKIDTAHTLQDLSESVAEANRVINEESTVPGGETIAYHEKLHTHLLTQLKKFLLPHHAHTVVQSSDADALKTLLSLEHIVQADEKTFYLDKFDHAIVEEESLP